VRNRRRGVNEVNMIASAAVYLASTR